MLSGHFDEKSNQIIVATEENVLAALSPETGNIVWRKVLELGDRGSIKLLHQIESEGSGSTSVRAGNRGDDSGFITVSGTGFVLVRGWNAKTGHLTWEWTLSNQKENTATHWFADQTTLYQTTPTWGSHVDIVTFNAKTGQQLDSGRVSISSGRSDNCAFVKSFLACGTSAGLVSVDLKAKRSETIAGAASEQRPEVVGGIEPLVAIVGKIFNLNGNAEVSADGGVAFLTKHKNENVLLQATVHQANIKVEATATDSKQWLASFEGPWAQHLAQPRFLDANCRTNRKNEMVCRALFTTENAALVLLQGGKHDSLVLILAGILFEFNTQETSNGRERNH